MSVRSRVTRVALLLVGLGWLALPIVAEAACTGASPTWTTTPDLASVAACVAGASAYDTINVTAGDGSETWDTTLTITKGINLIGPGAANLTITSGVANAYLIVYRPADYTTNEPFRLSGFTFDMNDQGGAVYLSATTGVVIQTNIRIDHNIFTNCDAVGCTVSGSRTLAQAIYGNVQRGVVDHNTITDWYYPFRMAGSYTNGKELWDAWEGIVFGKWDNNLYFEDNTISANVGVIVDCQYPNRYAFRYNTMTSPVSSYPFMDMHGNQGDGFMYACFGGEIYGNAVAFPEGQLLDQRAGKTAVFYNHLTGTGASIKLREEYCDDLNPTTNIQPQHVSGSYFWVNPATAGNNAPYISTSGQQCATYPLTENVDFWQYSAVYDGSAPGVGCGSSLPAACTTGDGYWFTAQSCSSISAYVGADHSATISGTFYRCKTANTWSSDVADGGFTPLTYPHPFLAVPPAPSSFAPVQVESTVYLQWAHSGYGVTHYRTVVDDTTTVIVGEPLVSGTTTTYRTALPALANGQHTVRVDACNWEGCTVSASIIVVKM